MLIGIPIIMREPFSSRATGKFRIAARAVRVLADLMNASASGTASMAMLPPATTAYCDCRIANGLRTCPNSAPAAARHTNVPEAILFRSKKKPPVTHIIIFRA